MFHFSSQNCLILFLLKDHFGFLFLPLGPSIYLRYYLYIVMIDNKFLENLQQLFLFYVIKNFAVIYKAGIDILVYTHNVMVTIRRLRFLPNGGNSHSCGMTPILYTPWHESNKIDIECSSNNFNA